MLRKAVSQNLKTDKRATVRKAETLSATIHISSQTMSTQQQSADLWKGVLTTRTWKQWNRTIPFLGTPSSWRKGFPHHKNLENETNIDPASKLSWVGLPHPITKKCAPRLGLRNSPRL